MAENLRTEGALRALGLAEQFDDQFGEERLAGGGAYRLELSAPDGPSTGGGAQALQHVKLVPLDGGATIVAGSANQADRIAELRSHAYLAHLHGRRFKGAPLPLDRVRYTDVLRKLEVFFADHKMRVVLIDAPTSINPPARGGLGALGWVLACLLLLGAIAVVGARLYGD
jgi:hypothetical protein